MEKEGEKEEKDSYEQESVLDKIVVPLIIILALGLAFLLVVKKKLISLLTGLSVLNGVSDSTTSTLILLCTMGIVLLVFYKIKKR